GPCGKGPRGPAPAAMGAGEHFPAAGRAVHALGQARIERDAEHRRLRLEPHVHPAPGRAAVRAAEQGAELALEVRAAGHPDGLGIARDLADVTAIRLALRVERLEPRARPVLALIGAAEEAGAADGEDQPRTPASARPAVQVDGGVGYVLTVAHVVPLLAAVETADDAAGLDRAVELARIDGIRCQLQHSLGRIRPGRHGNFGEAHDHRQLLPAFATVLAPNDLAVLVPGVHHARVAR